MYADQLHTKEDWIYAEENLWEFEIDQIVSLLHAGVSPENLDMKVLEVDDLEILEEEGLINLVLPYIDMG